MLYLGIFGLGFEKNQHLGIRQNATFRVKVKKINLGPKFPYLEDLFRQFLDVAYWIFPSIFEKRTSYNSKNAIFVGYSFLQPLILHLWPIRYKLHWREINKKLRDVDIYDVLQNLLTHLEVIAVQLTPFLHV